MLERHEIEALLTLAEELHFGRTAERLHVSTARISQTIAKLERRVGVPLFDRTSRRVELTAAGRRLHERLRPAWEQVTDAFEEAVAAGRGLTGTLRVAFVGAAGGQLLAGAAELFRRRHPECDVRLREAQMTDLMPWLRGGEIDLALGTFPVEEPGIATGPVLVSEARMLAVPAGHPFARRSSVSLEDLARTPLLQLPDTLPESLRRDRTPGATPSGRPIAEGPSAATFNEMLTLIGAGRGVFPVGAQARRYYARPDVAYIPFTDAPPLRWGLLWRADNATARVLAFAEDVHDLVRGDGGRGE
ncbi:LysR family transcriptional regulator [Actinomadura bangladeshensis]|uniref:LysR family transcriptional regulator n=1 Tax=Actinomadura bangladeshensis TaxID=453573 RepID=A0A6L9Q6P3_9ACTN|nr:LysR family transcriptional regulator [Actinomadura bangladeshensis]NEA21021.1 LysR family transcriptional regulator [Actinomadura bangladeshensis]